MKTAHADLPIADVRIPDAVDRSVAGNWAAVAIWLETALPIIVTIAACVALIEEPAIVGFGLACAAAVAWTWQLERRESAAAPPVAMLSIRTSAISEGTALPAADGSSRPRLASHRVLVCMTPDRPAAPELTAAVELADRLNGSLLAAYVRSAGADVDALKSTPSRDRVLAGNIELAELLGATVIKVDADDVSSGLVALVDREAVTHVVLGFSGDRASVLAPGSVVRAFVSRAQGVEVMVVGPQDR